MVIACAKYKDGDAVRKLYPAAIGNVTKLTDENTRFADTVRLMKARDGVGQTTKMDVDQLLDRANAITNNKERARALPNVAELQAAFDKNAALKTLESAATSARNYRESPSNTGVDSLAGSEASARFRAKQEFQNRAGMLSWIAISQFKLGKAAVARSLLEEALQRRHKLVMMTILFRTPHIWT